MTDRIIAVFRACHAYLKIVMNQWKKRVHSIRKLLSLSHLLKAQHIDIKRTTNDNAHHTVILLVRSPHVK